VSEADAGQAPPEARPRGRRWAAIAMAVILGVALAQLVLSAAVIGVSALVAQARLESMQGSLEARDLPAAKRDVLGARVAIRAAQLASWAPQVRAVGLLPGVGTPVDDVDGLVDAAAHSVDAAGQLVGAYASAVGDDDGTDLVSGGSVDVAGLAPIAARVSAARAEVDQAAEALGGVQGTFPGTGALAEARDDVSGVVEPLREALGLVDEAMPLLPEALGQSGPRRYLLVVGNSAELRPSGGAPLSVALLTFDKGALTITDRGQTSQEVLPGNPVIRWQHVTSRPFRSGTSPSRFVNANAHPDFRLAGEELARAWEASGKPAVNGVIALDTSAIIAGLRATGPVESPGFGTVSAENFLDTWIASYEQFDSVSGERQSFNNELATILISRLSGGDGALGLLTQLARVAPGRHLQVMMREPGLQRLVEEADIAGEISSPAGGDHAAWFSTNSNASKTDAFSRRALTIEAVVDASGGATVTQRMQVYSQVPEWFGDGRMIGYTTDWNRSGWFAYVPNAATDVAMVVPEGWGKAAQADDGLGRRFVVTSGWLAARASATMELTYRLPAGTFPDGVYRLTADPQPVVRTPALTVRAGGAAGTLVTVLDEVPFDSVVTVEQPTRG